jgi:hypothetical protein
MNPVKDDKLKVWPSILRKGESIHVDIEEPGELTVFSQQGAVLLKSELLSTTNSYSIQLPVGCYIVNVKTKNSRRNAKLLVI